MADVLEDDDLRLIDVLLEEALAQPAAAAIGHRRRWLAAAVVLFGAMVVAGVGWFARSHDHVATPQPQPEQPVDVDPAPAPPTPAMNVVKLRVLDRSGAAVRTFSLGLRQCIAGQPLLFAAVKAFPDRTITEKDFDGDQAVIRDLPDGEFVLQITADREARTRSTPFRTGGATPFEVTVQLTAGGELHGQVNTVAGTPIAGATVATGPDTDLDYRGDAFATMSALLPDVVTVTQAVTGADGRYRLPRLATGKYQLRIEHADHCGHVVRALAVTDEQPIEVPPAVLERGALVEGSVTGADAQPGTAKVTITRLAAAGGAVPIAIPFAMTVPTDERGRFRFRHRLTPGDYRIGAWRGVADNPLQQAAAMQRAARPLRVDAGQERIEQDLELPR
ncbi:MAG: carboxypeptidase regulatory-like domain-containing protein [Planctomycetes bacterium]|nr:carboxypeptidase regulatory-like domain-containing protein [Planctomycetota bacterium]